MSTITMLPPYLLLCMLVAKSPLCYYACLRPKHPYAIMHAWGQSTFMLFDMFEAKSPFMLSYMLRPYASMLNPFFCLKYYHVWLVIDFAIFCLPCHILMFPLFDLFVLMRTYVRWGYIMGKLKWHETWLENMTCDYAWKHERGHDM